MDGLHMKIYLKRVFKYTLDGRTVHKVLPGTYDVPLQVEKEVAKLALELGQAVIVPEQKVAKKAPKLAKKAPENKVLKAKESK
jgi:hypothetical protein